MISTHRPQAGDGGAERGAGQRELGDRRVEDALGAVLLVQAGRHGEHTAGDRPRPRRRRSRGRRPRAPRRAPRGARSRKSIDVARSAASRRRRAERRPAAPRRRRARDRLADAAPLRPRRRGSREHAVGLGLVDDRRLVGLDLDEPLAPGERVARRLQPARGSSPPPSSRTGAASSSVRASSRSLNSRSARGSGNGAASAAASISVELGRDLGVDLVESRPARRPRRPAARAERRAGRARASARARPAGRYLPGSLREWPDEAVGDRLDELGAAARAGLLDGPPSRRARRPTTLIPSIVSAGTSITSARARIAPAVTSSNGVYSP